MILFKKVLHTCFFLFKNCELEILIVRICLFLFYIGNIGSKVTMTIVRNKIIRSTNIMLIIEFSNLAFF